jgi:hypothetical protein
VPPPTVIREFGKMAASEEEELKVTDEAGVFKLWLSIKTTLGVATKFEPKIVIVLPPA